MGTVDARPGLPPRFGPGSGRPPREGRLGKLRHRARAQDRRHLYREPTGCSRATLAKLAKPRVGASPKSRPKRSDGRSRINRDVGAEPLGAEPLGQVRVRPSPDVVRVDPLHGWDLRARSVPARGGPVAVSAPVRKSSRNRSRALATDARIGCGSCPSTCIQDGSSMGSNSPGGDFSSQRLQSQISLPRCSTGRERGDCGQNDMTSIVRPRRASRA